MKAFYQCEVCGAKYSTEEKANECERKHKEAEERERKLSSEKKQRTDEINQLIKKFYEDYNVFPRLDIPAALKFMYYPFLF